MVMKVHGSVFSAPTMRVLIALHEKDLEFEFVFVDLRAGEHKKEHFLALNLSLHHRPPPPFGQVPAFEDGDLKLLVEAHQFDPAASKLHWELVYKSKIGMATDAAVVKDADKEANLAKVLDIYEARLSQSKYLSCDCFTLADLHHLSALTSLMGTLVKKLLDARPKVSAWVADIVTPPALAKVLTMRNQQ
ncbi:hypothetical protein EUGRSUZ_H01175 [Eucalyptus grandis]|uniref:Uncharacterized protein n=2 Tax=Eucalyptus grandis TaxID=71139 RepID=A0ACC3JNQ2_EUCGR|nr:hypothetical protein EUGRSUZ_H01175 [Eucalyptus grandis]